MNKRQRMGLIFGLGLIAVGATKILVKSPVGQEWFRKLCRDKVSDIWPSERITLRSGVREVMGTLCRVTAVADNEDVARESIQAAINEMERLEGVFDWRIQESELAKVNREASYGPVRLSDGMLEVLEFSIELSEASGGAFDITVGPVVDLWKAAKERGTLPSQEEIEEAKSRVGYEKLDLNKDTKELTFAVEGMRLDLGAIAKGYAIDKAVEAMVDAGAMGGLVDVGGDVRCFGAPPERSRLWVIGLQDPRNVRPGDVGNAEILLKLKLLSESVTTSGDYRRFVEVEGQRHSHIIDPAQGEGAKKFASVSIIAMDAKTADGYATAVSVMGLDEGLALVERTEGVEAIVIPKEEFGIIMSSGVGKYLE